MLLAYDDSGPGPVVVLLHGFPFDRTMWANQTAAVGATYRVIAPDLRGHGASDAPDGVYLMELLADDVLETLDSLGLREPVVLGGLSMGGYVALAAMARAPERFRGLILMDTRAGADTEEAAKTRREQAARVEASGDTTPVVEGMLPKLFSPLTRARRPEVIAPLQEVMARTTPRAVAGALRGMAARPDRTGELAAIRVPTLVIVGEDDVITPPHEARVLGSTIPGARLVVVPAAGHMAPVENSTVVNEAVLSFLNGLN